ncbi:MAG: S9 family peptidase [Ignavibacteriaceae bacterium]
MKIFKPIPILLLLFNLCSFAENDKDSTKININEWLAAGPIAIEMPVEAGYGESSFKEKDLLDFDELQVHNLYPEKGEKLQWSKDKNYEWEKVSGEEVELRSEDKTLPEITYLVTYIETERWLKAKLEIRSCQMLRAFVDGKEILTKTSTQEIKGDSSCKPEKSSKDIELERGKHILVLKALKSPKVNSDWNISASLIIDSAYVKEDIAISLSNTGYTTVEKLLEDPKIEAVSVSADGELAAVTVSDIPFGEDEKETWIDIYKTSDASLFRSYKGMNLTSVKWAPSGKRFVYTTVNKNKTDIWITNLDKGTSESLLTDIKDFGDYYWSPDESYIIYSVTEKASDDKLGIKLIEGMDERLPGAKNKVYMYKVTLPGGAKTRLTAGDKNLYLNSISNDGQKLLLSTTDNNWEKRPYSYSTYYILDISSMRMDSLITLYWANSAQFSPDAKSILFTGGPALFGDAGVNIKGDRTPSDFDTQAYIYNINSGNVEAITKHFNPSVELAYWSKNDNVIYFSATEKTFQHLYRYNIANKTFDLVNLEIEVLDKIDFANNKEEAVYKGSSITTPDKFYYVDIKTGKSRLLFNPAMDSYKTVQLGQTSNWTFKNARGEDIDGRIYYPPGFDKNKKYPVIVNYYGGTSPIERSFEGRYPPNIWAAHGYIVYIPQPSGATGYGQEFSAYHVNDWGNTTAREVIDGTKQFLAEHPFADSSRVGCIGASYGGFLTMNILTKTDIFAAGISHAGISNLSHYWGYGYWGYSYSAGATANSFPWNRKDIYVDYSPIYNADKINTPLLLLHGSSDTNVPPGESTQMFTALKLLGKDVKYIEVADQNHHILQYNKRKKWTKTIIAYFDMYLKGQPQWWDSIYSQEE